MKVSIASEAGHWYTDTGEPAYTVTGKNGTERPTTIRDARPRGLFPSVTTVLRLLDKPGLTRWLCDQHVLAALTLPRADGEDEATWLARVRTDAQEQARKARERGTEIHAAIEKLYRGVFAPDYADIVNATMDCVTENTGCRVNEWSAEKSAVSLEHGYGCKTDL